MAPPASKKGAGAAPKRERRSSSRQSTPLSESFASPTPMDQTPTASAPPPPSAPPLEPTPAMPKETPYLQTSLSSLISTEPSISTYIAGTSASKNPADPPSSKELRSLHDRIRDTHFKFMGRRGELCDRSMRLLVQKRKERAQMEAIEAQEEESRKKVKKEKAAVVNGAARKRSFAEMDGVENEGKEEEGKGLPSVGAHGLARQDGVGVHEGAPPPPSPPVQPGTAIIDPMDTATSPLDSGADSDDARADPPSAIPLYERAFGKDPTKFSDPTIYDIRPLTPSMTDDERRAILNVAHWPSSDLRDLTAGDPPDADFSNAKPANQVNFTTFQSYVEPFIRPFTEEDVAFLKERGDRFTPYVIPARGAKGYKDVWAAEDGLTGIEPPAKPESNPNEARGSMEDMDDSTAETDEVSLGPVMNRLLSVVRPAPNGNNSSNNNAKKEEDGDANGDVAMVNGDDSQEPTLPGAGSLDEPVPLAQNKPTLCLPPDAPRPQILAQMDYESLDQRALLELRYLGFLSPTDTPGYTSHADDEVAARLRTLQHELRRVSRANNIRKSRVLELTEERMAMQEYSNIADDLDNQVNAAYLKRNRSLAKPSNKKGSAASQNAAGRKGVAGVVGAVGARGVSEGVRALMQKRRDWIEMVGPVVGYGRGVVLGEEETVFDAENLRRLERGEREAEMGEGEEG